MKLFFKLIFILLTLNAHEALAFDCEKAVSNIDKLICSDTNLTELDRDYNKTYQEAIRNISSKEVLKTKIKHLLKARNECVKFYEKTPIPKMVIKPNSEEYGKEFFILDKTHFIKGCIATWYISISNAINYNQNYSDYFEIPSYEEYINSFNELKEWPYLFEITYLPDYKVGECAGTIDDENIDDEDYEQQTYCFNSKIELSASKVYKLFFLTKQKNFTQIIKEDNTYNRLINGPHSGFTRVLTFLVNNHEIPSNSFAGDSCPLSFENPYLINGNIYFPQRISFTEFFHKMLGDYSDIFRCYASQCDNAVDDCLVKLKKWQGNDDYVAFDDYNSGKGDNNIFNTDKIASEKVRQCALNILKKNQTAVDIKNLEAELFFIKSSESSAILNKIKNNCFRKKK